MRLRKFTAVSLAAAMTAAAITGCGNREQEKPDVKTEGREVSAESFSDALKKSSNISSYDYTADISFSIKANDLFTYTTEEAEQILDTLGIASDKVDLKFTVNGSVKGTDAQTITLGFEVGNLSGDLTEIVYVDDTLYVNVAKTVDVIEQVADKFGMKNTISTYLTLLPEGDYISVSKDTLTQFAEAFLKSAYITADDFNISKTDTEAVEKAVYYLMDEVEKAAKKAENVYSSQNGYSISINNSNMLSFMTAGITVLAEDRDEIIKNIKTVTGDANMDISIEDAFDKIKISTEEEREKLLEDIRTAKEEMPEFDFTVTADYSGKEGSAVASFDCSMNAKDNDADITMSVNAKITEKDVKISAPKSVMAQEDIEALLSLIGIDSTEDITDMFGGTDNYGYNFNDDLNIDNTAA
ncbi:MAG: hypothetical protein HFH63_05070 [Lachnospiraceae bacterium]|jgi:hypothetical protein|nr:hypothetical protein [Lachnospiraceae bacterium]